jgi:branched-subunit amino acid transport protein
MHVTSRIAGSINPVNYIPTIAIVALENRPILDVSGSAFVAKWNPNGQSAIVAVEIHWYSRDSISVIF